MVRHFVLHTLVRVTDLELGFDEEFEEVGVGETFVLPYGVG